LFKIGGNIALQTTWLIVILAGFLMSIAAIAHRKRWWLSFYLTGAVSFMSFMIAFFMISGLDVKIMGIEAQNIATLSTAIGIPATFLPPNAFLFEDPTGWTIFGIGFECSSIIEISVLIGLLLLYPGYGWKRKTKYAIIGTIATYCANLIRMMSIVYIVNIFGKSYLYFAHAIVGKLIFFLFIIILYWYLLTRPTIGIIRDNIKGGKFEY
jgi:exosortase family protein XrtG